MKLETPRNNCSVDFDAFSIPPVTTASDVRMLRSRRWENDEFFSARAVESSLQYSVIELLLRRKAAFPLTNDIEADESLRTVVFSQFRGNDEA